MWRRAASGIEVLLGHFGGPFWARRNEAAWAIPKGLVEPGETLEEAARREFEEEVGLAVTGRLVPLGRIRQKAGKWVESFAVEGDFDPDTLSSQHIPIEWPPRSGNVRLYPEIDRAAWFPIDNAYQYILPSQRPILDVLRTTLDGGGTERGTS